MWASSTVRPAVACTIASAAAIQSLIWSVKPSTRTRGLSPKRARACLLGISLRPAMQTTSVSPSASASSIARSRSPTPQPPPETSTMRAWASTPSASRASRRVRGARNSGEIGGRAHSTVPGRPAARLPRSTRVGDVVKVDARVRPVAQPGQVGDRRLDRNAEAALLAQHPEHHGDARVGRDDDVRVALGDRAAARRAGEEVAEVLDSQRVGANFVNSQYWTSKIQGAQRKTKREPSRSTAARACPSPRDRVDRHLDAGDLLFEVGFDHPRRQVVALADVGGEDEDARVTRLARPRGAREQRPGGAVVAVHRGLRAGDRVRRAGRALDPFDVLADAVLEGRVGFPAELVEGALVGDRLAREVTRTRRRVGDLAGVDVFLHPLGDFEDRRDLVAGEVVGAAGRLRGERGDDPVGEVLDVDEAAGGAAVAGDRQRLAFEGEVGEFGDDAGGAGARAVGDAEAQDREVEVVGLRVAGAVGLARELGRGVEVARGRDRGFLVDLLLGQSL